MKNFICFMALAFIFSSCDNIKEKDLPITAQTFISTHFPDATFIHGERDKEDGSIIYDVKLSNGTELEFAQSGDWIYVDCRYSFMPDGIIDLIPIGIKFYFTENHPTAKIMKIEKELGGYEININSPTGDFHFSSDGTFIRYEQ